MSGEMCIRDRFIEGNKRRRLANVRFRNKVEGWKNSHFTAVYDDGTADSAPLFATGFGLSLIHIYPTLLLTADQWASMADHPANYPKGGYILCYLSLIHI